MAKRPQTHHLTKEWYDKLVEELHKLRDTDLPATLERLKEAISQWDISENAEYDTAMSEKELIEGRIAEIEEIINNVEIIDEKKKKTWEIVYGSKVKFTDDKKREYEMTIVGSGEVDVLASTISFESPLWIAIRGKKKWDKVFVKAPSRKYEIVINSVK